MAIPKFEEFLIVILEILSDGKEHNIKEIKEKSAENFNLTDEEIKELLPSGTQSIVNNRVGWGRTYLKKAGLIESKKRGIFNITKEGLKLLSNKPDKITVQTLENYSSFREFRYGNDDNIDNENKKSYLSPEEKIENSFLEIKNELANSLLEEVKKKSPEFFERLVIDLLLKMGYGGSRASAGKTVGKTGDEGIDGIVDEDKLGLDKIYIQAKRYSDSSIGRPELQKFVGALGGQGATKGIFITTSKFTGNAIEYVKNQAISNVVLIDGERLSELMIDYDVGVSTKWTYKIKQFDSDYFESE